MIDGELLQKVSNAREEGKKIGLVQGSWDVFHLGHLLYIKEAKKRCDFLVVAIDDDEKIRKRKGNHRPIISLKNRKKIIESLEIADEIAVKGLDEKKWELIKSIRPDVLVVIMENYSEEEIKNLEEFCGNVAILPRQSEIGTTDIIRLVCDSEEKKQPREIAEGVIRATEEMKLRIGFSEEMMEPLPQLLEHLKESTDWKCPVAAGCFWNGEWHFGTNKVDLRLPKYDLDNRTELFYATTRHAELNLLKSLGDVEVLNTPVWVTLFPCDICMKVLINKGVKEIYYLEDHPEKNWSKRSHELAKEKGIKTIKIMDMINTKTQNDISETIPEKDVSNDIATETSYKFIDPRNVRNVEQLEIMLQMEAEGKDPLDPRFINQEILFQTDYWHVSRNKFPYEEIEHQFLIASMLPIYKTEDMTPGMWADLKDIWAKLVSEYNIPGGALCCRFGETSYSGASLTRLHCHLIMPKEAYKTRFTIGGNQSQEKVRQLIQKNQG